LEQQLPVLVEVVIRIGDSPTRSSAIAIELCLQAIISKPSPGIRMIAANFTIDQIKDAATAISFMVEPGILI
jgi:hypothetical protein